MPELDAQQPTLSTAAGSRKLARTVTILAILPLVLSVLFYGIADELIFPGVEPRVLQCASFNCPSAANWNRLGWFLALGPSFLVAVASILFGTIGLIHARRHPTSPENIDLLQGSVISGVLWAGLLGGILWVLLSLAGIFD